MESNQYSTTRSSFQHEIETDEEKRRIGVGACSKGSRRCLGERGLRFETDRTWVEIRPTVTKVYSLSRHDKFKNPSKWASG
ncbi:hypothetical protein CDAR_399631 [Caerostris darwini]|uniref:Uncharacterized protein n=1 Tax=Caerostris darwini TaxID=1538125 RepID=A0AAV4RKT7_9ARAC|nr:hypothetical protein CDAR_399631 [Caerostris darwini]